MIVQVGVCYAGTDRQEWTRLEIAENSSVEEVIRQSNILQRFPEIDLNKQKVGIFGKVVALDSLVKEGDRIEIYRPITADPKNVRRRRTGSGSDD